MPPIEYNRPSRVINISGNTGTVSNPRNMGRGMNKLSHCSHGSGCGCGGNTTSVDDITGVLNYKVCKHEGDCKLVLGDGFTIPEGDAFGYINLLVEDANGVQTTVQITEEGGEIAIANGDFGLNFGAGPVKVTPFITTNNVTDGKKPTIEIPSENLGCCLNQMPEEPVEDPVDPACAEDEVCFDSQNPDGGEGNEECGITDLSATAACKETNAELVVTFAATNSESQEASIDGTNYTAITSGGTIVVPTATGQTVTLTVRDTENPDCSESIEVAVPDCSVVEPIKKSDLEVKSKSFSPNSDGTGGTFSIEVANNGPDDEPSAVATDLIDPSKLTITSNTPSVGTYDPATGKWTLGAFANGATATIEIEVAFVEGEEVDGYINTVTITGDNEDPNTENNSGSATVEAPFYEMLVVKSVSNVGDIGVDEEGNIGAGGWGFDETHTWKIEVTNTGNRPITPTINDNLPPCTSIVDGTTFPQQPTIQPGATHVIEFDWTVEFNAEDPDCPKEKSSITNTVTVVDENAGEQTATSVVPGKPCDKCLQTYIGDNSRPDGQVTNNPNNPNLIVDKENTANGQLQAIVTNPSTGTVQINHKKIEWEFEIETCNGVCKIGTIPTDPVAGKWLQAVAAAATNAGVPTTAGLSPFGSDLVTQAAYWFVVSKCVECNLLFRFTSPKGSIVEVPFVAEQFKACAEPEFDLEAFKCEGDCDPCGFTILDHLNDNKPVEANEDGIITLDCKGEYYLQPNKCEGEEVKPITNLALTDSKGNTIITGTVNENGVGILQLANSNIEAGTYNIVVGQSGCEGEVLKTIVECCECTSVNLIPQDGDNLGVPRIVTDGMVVTRDFEEMVLEFLDCNKTRLRGETGTVAQTSNNDVLHNITDGVTPIISTGPEDTFIINGVGGNCDLGFDLRAEGKPTKK